MIAGKGFNGSREPLGSARWHFPHVLSASEKEEQRAWEETAPKKPDGYNQELHDAFSGGIEGVREKWGVDESRDFGIYS